ncbi:helix-turn-helix transcriptional regulator [Amycolatopsis kentuckyensis]|uniref:helix-turn-helix transcriptional regulator n=1 Tax=Amycolatopsis kentuckyensis TaxID=218823 RepID=UPI001177E973|nr:helix-turn-helix domain-containing protein [Amycolatopsis kentuckyensis]
MTETRYLTTPQLSKRWGIPEGTLIHWRKVGRGPKYYKLGRHVRYREADIQKFEAASAA